MPPRSRRAPLFLSALLALAAVLFASPGGAEESPFEWSAEARRHRETPERAELRFRIDVPPGHYLYRHMLTFALVDTARFRAGEVELPKGKTKYDPFLEEETEIYEHSITVRAFVEALPGVPFPDTIRAVFGFQGCTSEFCYFPEEEEVALDWRWTDDAAAGGPAAPPGSAPGTRAEAPAPPSPAAEPGSFDVGRNIASRGLFFTYLVVFFSGILLSFTPCVFPMIPITLSIIGARGETRPAKGFLLSLVYVLGMAITYALLGFVAASTGAIFGSILQNPYFVGAVVVIFVVLALGMFGLFELQVPSSAAVRLQTVGGGGGWVGIFLMGIVAGLIASPCVGPVLVGLLVYIAQTGNAFLGFTLLFPLAMGIGVLFLAIGTFSGLLGTLPGAGGWMDAVKRFFGFLLLGVAVYYMAPFLPDKLVLCTYGLLLVFGSVFFGLFEPLHAGASAWSRIGRACALLAAAAGIVLVVGSLVLPLLPFSGTAGAPAKAAKVAWIADYDLGIAEAASAGKPVLIDFTADWCAACRELEHKTYTDPAVIGESGRFVTILVDCTRSTDKIRSLLDQYDVKGLPTIVLLDSSGKRREDLTVTGFVEPKRFLEILRAVG